MRRYRIIHKQTNQGGEVSAESMPHACRLLGLNYMECLWTELKSTKGIEPTKHYVGRENDG